MNKLLKRLMIIKDVLWAFGIILCLSAVLIGFLTAAISRYNGESRDRSIDFSHIKMVDEGKAPAAPSGPTIVGNVRTPEATRDAGDSYINSLTFLCDSTLIGLREMHLVNADVWGSESGKLPVSAFGTWNIVYSDGSKIPPSSAAMIVKPKILMLCVGSDSLAETGRDIFISGYSSLISDIRRLSPATQIICCPILPTAAGYQGEDGLNNDLIAEANTWITQLRLENDLMFCNIAESVSSGGSLIPDYAGASGTGLNIAGLQQVITYLRTHAIT